MVLYFEHPLASHYMTRRRKWDQQLGALSWQHRELLRHSVSPDFMFGGFRVTGWFMAFIVNMRWQGYRMFCSKKNFLFTDPIFGPCNHMMRCRKGSSSRGGGCCSMGSWGTKMMMSRIGGFSIKVYGRKRSSGTR